MNIKPTHSRRAALHQYRVHCAGLQYITWARSACEAIISAIDLHGTPATSARRLP